MVRLEMEEERRQKEIDRHLHSSMVRLEIAGTGSPTSASTVFTFQYG